LLLDAREPLAPRRPHALKRLLIGPLRYMSYPNIVRI
jgi:hypothetical protein